MEQFSRNTSTASTDNPIALLRACHVKIADHTALLERIRQHIDLHGVDEAAQEAIEKVIRYFVQAAPLHHQDEEVDLFPLLAAAAKAEDYEDVLDALAFLQEDHIKLDTLWQSMLSQLQTILTQRSGNLDPATLRLFTAAYQRHIEAENSLILPYAQATLDQATLARLGQSMKLRRSPG